MNRPIAKRRAATPGLPGLARVLPEIQSLIEASRQHVVSTANLTLVWLYWNVGRVITQDIQKSQKRAGYGDQLLAASAGKLTEDYGRGFSRPNLQDMRRFFGAFEICQTASSKSASAEIPQPVAGNSSPRQTLSTVSRESSANSIRQPLAAESEDRLQIDFSKHSCLDWTQAAAGILRRSGAGGRGDEGNNAPPGGRAGRGSSGGKIRQKVGKGPMYRAGRGGGYSIGLGTADARYPESP